MEQMKSNYDVLGMLLVQGSVQHYQEQTQKSVTSSNILGEYFINITQQLQDRIIQILRNHLLSLFTSLDKIDQLGIITINKIII